MIKEAIEKLVSLSNGEILSTYGRAFSRHTLQELPSPDALARPIEVHTLSGLIEYVRRDFDMTGNFGIFVRGPQEVALCSRLTEEFRQREEIAVAKPFLGRGFPYAQHLDQEQFIVNLQACFVPDETTAAILRVVGNMTQEAVRTAADDGISQTVTARCGVTRVANVPLPNPVVLRPYRTFQEIEQPSSRFVLRMKGEGDKLPTAALFEADDNEWKLAAVRSIRAFLDAAGLVTPVFA